MTWTADPQRTAAPDVDSWTWNDLRRYAVAVGAVGAALAVTRVTWPLFAPTPFVPLFAAVFIAARWSSETASLLSLVLAVMGATVMAPVGDVQAPAPWMIVVFVGASLAGNRIVVGRNRAEATLRTSEAQFRAAWDHVAFGAALLNAHGQVERINPAMERALGYPSAAWAGVSFAYFCLNEAADERTRFAALMAGSEPSYQREQCYRRADGAAIWCRVTMSVIDADERGRRAGALMVLEDVTDRRRMEEVLRASEHHYRHLFSDNPQAMWVYDVTDQRFLAVNRAALARYGYAPAEFLALTLDDLVVPEGRASINAACGSGRHRTKEGRILDVQVDTSFVPWGGRTARLELVHDVTERTQLREQLGQSQKMEAIGQLAGGIAHDFNNLLTTIVGYADLLLMQIGPEHPMWSDLHEMQAAATSAGLLTHQLLAFSRRQPANLTVVDVNDAVTRLSQMLRRALPADIEVDLVLGQSPLRSKADGSQLEQVVMNLVLNARDAIRGAGGRISIRTSLATFGQEHLGGRAGTYVVLEVVDNGCGMDAATKARVFEPFFTTKAAGLGTGLGLAVVYGIVQHGGGHVEVESEVGRGSTFRVHLPWTDEPVRVDRSVPTAPETLAGSERVLIVEDSTELRLLVSRVLKRYGYLVYETGTPDEAMALARRKDLTVDVVVMDVVMPRMTGPEVMTYLRSAWPGVAVLYMSGYSRDALAQRGIQTDEAELMTKPFSAFDLLTRVRRLFDRPAVERS